MNFIVHKNKKLLYQFEVLHARLAIRELFLKTTVREVYENIGQVLSLVRMQLNFLIPEAREISTDHLQHSGNLVGQSIRDLRHMCRSFYPDVEIEKEGGFIDGLKNNLKIIEQNTNCEINEAGKQKKFSQGLGLIVFMILQDLFIVIKQAGGTLKDVHINYDVNTVIYNIHYKGKEIDFVKDGIQDAANEHLNIQDRVSLIGGTIHIDKRKAENIHIQLTSPLKNTTYE